MRKTLDELAKAHQRLTYGKIISQEGKNANTIRLLNKSWLPWGYVAAY